MRRERTDGAVTWQKRRKEQKEKKRTEGAHTNLMSAITVLARCCPSRTDSAAAIIPSHLISKQLTADG